ncbi:Histidinol dehydrogenase [Salmonella enterica subsp. enterica serovar Baildon str. R6-199]|nr:Histidinol dehydrogenase [Salmonella enterica subsp. enterica serovar Baildon str. R6-199]
MALRALLTRPAISASDSITRTVSDILDNVKTRGDDALREYSAKFDKTEVTALRVTPEEIAAAGDRRRRRASERRIKTGDGHCRQKY